MSAPKTNKDNLLSPAHISSLVDWFVENDKNHVGLIEDDFIVDSFNNGFLPFIDKDTWHDPQKYNNELKKRGEKIPENFEIKTPKAWLTVKIILCLNQCDNTACTQKVPFKDVISTRINLIGDQIDKTIIKIFEIAKKYDVDFNGSNVKYLVDRIEVVDEKESFILNYISDSLGSAEVRILAWIYKELFFEDFKFIKPRL